MPPYARTLALLALLATSVHAQNFTSGSDGSDGPLDFSDVEAGTTVLFDPASFDPPLDSDGDGVFNFTTVTIPEGVTVKLTSTLFGGLPGYWLATGDVVIAGTLDLSGEDGHEADGDTRRNSIPGPGGFGGGVGLRGNSSPTNGLGPGAGRAGTSLDSGGGAGHRLRGSAGANLGGSASQGGPAYGNPYLQPLLGGSGGAGGRGNTADLRSGGGGAGGGAILIASSTRIEVTGTIDASGGNGGRDDAGNSTERATDPGGGGSGGAIRLAAPSVSGSGRVDASGGNGSGSFPGGNGSGSEGFIRIESRTAGVTFQSPTTVLLVPLSPNTPLLPADVPSAVRIVSIDGEEVDITPRGNVQMPDLTLDTALPVEVELQAEGIPTGTTLTLSILSAELGEQIFTSTPLEGTLQRSTATASVQFPPTISQMFVRATWTP